MIDKLPGSTVVVPVPDPTKLTTEQLDRASKSQKKLFRAELAILRQRVECIEEATKEREQHHYSRREETLANVRGEISGLHERRGAELANLRDALKMQMESMETRSRARKDHIQQLLFTQMTDRDQAVTAALNANKEQANERQVSVNKSLDQLAVLMRTTTDGISSSVNQLRDRITVIESRSKGSGDAWTGIAAAIGMVWGVASTIALVFTHITH